MNRTQSSTFVEIKTVTWSKDSHGLFDYESKNVNFTKIKVDTSSKIYKHENEIAVKSDDAMDLAQVLSSHGKPMDYLFSVYNHEMKKDKYSLQVDPNQTTEETKKKDLFIIIRSLKNEDGTQKGYRLELGDILRVGRIEYRVIEYQNHEGKIASLLNSSDHTKACPFTLDIKDCNTGSEEKKQCRICLMDETDCPEVLVNPCDCKGTSAHVHIKCLQDWISSKSKKKINPHATCFYWKKLNCEICKVDLPDLVDIDGEKLELVPIERPQKPYMLLERVFYDKSKTSADNAKMMLLVSLSSEDNQIKLGRGHECDLRENDISVSRLHALIKYENGKFVVFDNNSKFGTLVMLRKDYEIERSKIALQIGRTVISFSLKQSSVNNVPIFKNPSLMRKLTKAPAQSANVLNCGSTPSFSLAGISFANVDRPEKNDDKDIKAATQNGSLLDL